MSPRIIDVTLDDLRQLIREELAARETPAPAPIALTYLSVPQAADRAGCSADTIRAWIRSGRLPDRRVGGGRGHYRVAVADLDAAMQGPRHPAVVDPAAVAVAMLARRR